MEVRHMVRENREAIAKRIREHREAQNISASAFARLVGVTPTAVWNWEKNAITPRDPALKAIAKALDVSTTFLLTGKEHTRESEASTAESVASAGTAESVASILEDAKARLAKVTGVAVERVKLNVQFVTE
jgi:transcriptional regulator with XRE-family HTH domain